MKFRLHFTYATPVLTTRLSILFNKAFVDLPHAIAVLKVFDSYFQTASSYDIISELEGLRLLAVSV
jgi:hypothetical protein